MVTITKILALKRTDIFLCKENNQPIKRFDLFSQKKTNLNGQKIWNVFFATSCYFLNAFKNYYYYLWFDHFKKCRFTFYKNEIFLKFSNSFLHGKWRNNDAMCWDLRVFDIWHFFPKWMDLLILVKISVY